MKRLALAMLLLAAPTLARAGDDGETQGEDEDDSSFMSLAAGVKGGAGGNLLTDSKNVPSWPLTPFDGSGTGAGGGWSAGGGVYAEFFVLWGFLSLELDFYFEHSTLWTDIDHNVDSTKVAESRWSLEWTNVRIPLLLKGNITTGILRVSLGLGPEFVVGVSPEGHFELLEGQAAEGDEAYLDSIFDAREQTDTYFCAVLGFAVQVWRLAITFDIRYAYNPTQPEDYLDRMSWTVAGSQVTGIEMIASSTMDLHLLLGVAYEFDL